MCKNTCSLQNGGKAIFSFKNFFFFFWGGPLLKYLWICYNIACLYTGFWPWSTWGPARDGTPHPLRWNGRVGASGLQEVPGRAILSSTRSRSTLWHPPHQSHRQIQPLRKCFRDFLGNILLLCDLLHQMRLFVPDPWETMFCWNTVEFYFKIMNLDHNPPWKVSQLNINSWLFQ